MYKNISWSRNYDCYSKKATLSVKVLNTLDILFEYAATFNLYPLCKS